MPPASLRDSPRSAGGSDPGFFQITTSALGARVCESLYLPCKSGVSISHSPHGSPAFGSRMSAGTAVKNMCLEKELILILGAQVS